MRVVVHPRVSRKRPDLVNTAVVIAFEHAMLTRARTGTNPLQWVGIGLDPDGRLLEWVAVEQEPDGWLVFHAAPATEKTLKEVGLK